jgi:hypothetical protein
MIKRKAPTVAFVIFLAILALLRALVGFTSGDRTLIPWLSVALGAVLLAYANYSAKRSQVK